MTQVQMDNEKPGQVADVHTVQSRENIRRELAADVEAFLRRGGAIQALAHGQTAFVEVVELGKGNAAPA